MVPEKLYHLFGWRLGSVELKPLADDLTHPLLDFLHQFERESTFRLFFALGEVHLEEIAFGCRGLHREPGSRNDVLQRFVEDEGERPHIDLSACCILHIEKFHGLCRENPEFQSVEPVVDKCADGFVLHL